MYIRIPTVSILRSKEPLEDLFAWIDWPPDGVAFHQRCGGLKVWVISEDAVDPERFLDELGTGTFKG